MEVDPATNKRTADEHFGESSSTHRMQGIQEEEKVIKKIRVNADDTEEEMNDQRRGRIQLNPDQKTNVLRWIIACHIQLTALLTDASVENDQLLNDIHVSQQVTSIFSTSHSCLRQTANGVGSLNKTMSEKNHQIQLGGNKLKMVPHVTCMELVKQIATSFKLEYSKPDKKDNNHWYGTAAPIIDFINMFRTRVNELRMGHSSFIIKKDSDKVKTVTVSQYGFWSAHHPYLEGVTLSPEKKSGMAQSLGPLTALICLAQSSSEGKYSERWKSAVKRDLAFIPEIDSVVNLCSGKGASFVRGVYNIIADILLITTSREAKRSSFPACMLYKLLDDGEYKHYLQNRTICQTLTDISWFNFSGIGPCYLYKKVQDLQWKFPIKPEFQRFIPEIVFHRIWGTYATDTGILEFMTNYGPWSNRNKMGDAFSKMGQQMSLPFNLIKLHKYSKMSSANQTGLLSLSSNPVIGKSAFSGKHKQIFTDEFLDYLEKTQPAADGSVKNIETLKNLLAQTRESLRKDCAANKSQMRGTTSWYSVDGCTTKEYGKELDDIPQTNNQLFMMSN